jgi:hypothetical protein
MKTFNIMVNYCCNRFLPYVFVGFLLFWHLGYITWPPYAILAFIFFIDRFSFKTGYAVAYCEKRGIDMNKPPA